MISQTYNLNIGDISIPYTLINSSKSKHIRISMSIDGLKITKPNRVKIDTVEKLLRTKLSWIYKHYIELQLKKSNIQKREWKSGENILYKGIKYNISVSIYDKKKTIVNFNGNSFEVFVSELLNDEQKKVAIKEQFKKYFIKMAKESIQNTLQIYVEKLGLLYNNISIKEQKTRWGSCSKKCNLNFNWKLIMAPQFVLDYVVLHEVCHLKYLNHSKQFWHLIEVNMPEYKSAKFWLKKNGIELGI